MTNAIENLPVSDDTISQNPIDPKIHFEDEFSYEIWRDNYKTEDEKTVEDTWMRVASSLASVEDPTKIKEWTDKFYDLLKGFKATPGGRILSNAGKAYQGTTLINCFVGPKPKYDQDSLEGIIETLLYQSQTLKSEGGWGMNFSFIRPRGSFIHGIGVESPGSVKYMELFDKSSEIITSGSGKKKRNKKGKKKIRKGAMMSVLDCWHPDIEEFIRAKQNEGRLSKFNISVNCNDEFMSLIIKLKDLEKNNDERLKELDKWDLVFPDTTHEKYKEEWDGDIRHWKEKGYPVNVYKTVSALGLWKSIMQSTYNRNDPGVLFLDNANRTHLFNYGGRIAHIAATNPCGEQTLPFSFVCDLGSLNLTKFVDIENRRFDLEAVKKYVTYLVRLLDNVNSYTNAPIDEYQKSIEKYRRIGIGVMGWGSALYLLKIRYGSDEAEAVKAELMKALTHAAVNASIDLAKEKGPFDGCDPEKHANHIFWDQIELPDELRKKMRKYGIRNSALFSIQPTGNTGIFANVASGGLEPVFLWDYIRTVIVNELPDHIKDVCPAYWEGEFKETEMFKLTTEGTDQVLKGTDEFGVVYKIDKNRGLTREVLCSDYGVRKLKELGEWDPESDWAATTANLSVEDHIRDLNGFGKWIDSSMSKTVNLPKDYSFEDFQDLYLEAYKGGVLKGLTTYREGTMTSVLSSVDSNKKDEDKEDKITKTNAPKRPQTLEASIHHVSVKGEKYFVIVGMFKGEPYEVFAGKNGFIPKSTKVAEVKKVARGKYSAILDNGQAIDSITDHISDEEEAITRMTSASLRHGVDIAYVVHQLEKTKGDLQGFSKAMARALKKHVKDGTKVTGEECEICKSDLSREEGCIVCRNCGWAKCQ